jgi:hypothetical protein
MSINREQFEQFLYSRVPEAITVSKADAHSQQIFSGREALISKVTTRGNMFAFKWYASLSGKSIRELSEYGKGVNEDEQLFKQAGLDLEQVPNHSFFIAEFGDQPELFAMQPWVEGRILKDVPFSEIVQNRALRLSLAELFEECVLVYENSKRIPDIVGGDRVNFFGKELPDPRKVVWPFYSTNIMVSSDKAVLLDAKTHQTQPGTLKYQVIKHRLYVAAAFAHLLKL